MESPPGSLLKSGSMLITSTIFDLSAKILEVQPVIYRGKGRREHWMAVNPEVRQFGHRSAKAWLDLGIFRRIFFCCDYKAKFLLGIFSVCPYNTTLPIQDIGKREPFDNLRALFALQDGIRNAIYTPRKSLNGTHTEYTISRRLTC